MYARKRQKDVSLHRRCDLWPSKPLNVNGKRVVEASELSHLPVSCFIRPKPTCSTMSHSVQQEFNLQEPFFFHCSLFFFFFTDLQKSLQPFYPKWSNECASCSQAVKHADRILFSSPISVSAPSSRCSWRGFYSLTPITLFVSVPLANSWAGNIVHTQPCWLYTRLVAFSQ